MQILSISELTLISGCLVRGKARVRLGLGLSKELWPRHKETLPGSLLRVPYSGSQVVAGRESVLGHLKGPG